MTAFMVMAVATVGLCGPPVGAGEGAAGVGPGAGQMGMPAGTSGGDGAAQAGGLTITPGGGYGSPGGSGSGSPTLLLSELGVKNQLMSVQRVSYFIPMPKMNSGFRIVGDAVNNWMSASGFYGMAATGVDPRLGHNLDVTYNAGLYNLQAQVDYSPISGAKTFKVGPTIGLQWYSDSFEVSDITAAALSSSATHTASFVTFGGWGEIGLPDVIGLAGSRARSFGDAMPVQPRVYLSALWGVGKDWSSFNWEAMLSLFTINKKASWSGSRYGKYMPVLRADIGYAAYYFTQARQDTGYLNGVTYPTLNENIRTDFGVWVLRGNLTF